MAHQGRVNARSTSMQNRVGGSDVEKICQSRFDNNAPESAHAFVMQQLQALPQGCDLEAPLPMEQILEAAAELQPGEELIARTPCFPRPLLAQLDRRQLDWQAAEAAEASGLIWIGRPG